MPSLKTWPTSSPAFISRGLPQRGQAIAGFGVPQVEDALERKVASGNHAGQVHVDGVAADDDGRHRGDRPNRSPAGS